MSILEISQIIFNVTASLAIIIVGVLVGTIAFEVMIVVKRVKKLVHEVKQESAYVRQKLDSFLLAITSLSFVSKLFKKNTKTKK